MNWPLCTSSGITSREQFWSGILVYHNRPQLINKKIAGFKDSHVYRLTFTKIANISEYLSYSSLIYETRKLQNHSEQNLTDLLESLLKPYDKNVTIEKTTEESIKIEPSGVFICVRVLIGKRSECDCVEVCVIDKDRDVIIFSAGPEKDYYKNVIAPPFLYELQLTKDSKIQLNVKDIENAETSSADWLAEHLFTKVIKWMENFEENDKIIQGSLTLINVEEYTSLYQSLKVKYSKELIRIWPENTDPLKFVFEDLAIAAYLISLWTQYSGKKTFLDLGCGNGLLVYILNEEGYQGYGIDVRKRKIWDYYPSHVRLEVKTFTPTNDNFFRDVNWIIGNHSDELTPWIPVITAKSDYKSNFFLLPCCSYEFNGSKFKRNDLSKSGYSEYLDYVRTVSENCGFNVVIDKLRIPSTKRTCLVSKGRVYGEKDFNAFTEIDKQLHNKYNIQLNNDNWIDDFKPRDKVEIVRNCTKLDRAVITSFVLNIFNKIMSCENFIAKSDGLQWNKGGSFTFAEVIASLDNADLKKIKQENGGLQTLIKNHRYIFEISKGKVQIRLPPSSKVEGNKKYSEKICWFYKNHPNGCLYLSKECACIHK